MKLKELKSIVEEREQLKSEIKEIRYDERDKLDSINRSLLNRITEKLIYSNVDIIDNPTVIELECSFFSKEAVASIKEKLARIQAIEKELKLPSTLKMFNVEFPLLKKYLEQYFKEKYNLDIDVRLMLNDKATRSVDLAINVGNENYHLLYTHLATEYDLPTVINIAPLIISNMELNGIVPDFTLPGFTFYQEYKDFKNALWYAISATKKNKLQKDIEFAKNRVEGSTENLENLESTKYLLKLYKQLKEKIRKDIDYQRKKVEENRRELKNLEARLDDYTINE